MGPPIPPLTLVPVVFALAWGNPAAISNSFGCTSSTSECQGTEDSEHLSTMMQIARSDHGLNFVLNHIKSMKKSVSAHKLESLVQTLLLSRAVTNVETLEDLKQSVIDDTITPLLQIAEEAQKSLENKSSAYYELTYNQSHTTAVVQALLEGIAVIESCIETRQGQDEEKKKKCTELEEFDLNFGSLCLEEYLKTLETFKDKNELSPALEKCGTNALDLAVAHEPLRLACKNATEEADATGQMCIALYDAFSKDYCKHRDVESGKCQDYRDAVNSTKFIFQEAYTGEMSSNVERRDEYKALQNVLCIIDLMISESLMDDVAKKVSVCGSKAYDLDNVTVKHDPLKEKEDCSIKDFGDIESRYTALDIESPGKCEWKKEATASFNKVFVQPPETNENVDIGDVAWG